MKKLKDIIIGAALLLVTLVATAQEVNFRRVENAHIIDAITLDTISSHSSDAEAKQELLNWQFANREVYMLGAIYVVDVKNPEIIRDTVYLNSNWDQIQVVDTIAVDVFKWGITPLEGIYLKDNSCINLYQVPMDSIQRDSLPYRNFTAYLEETKDWPSATSSYKLIEAKNIHDFKAEPEVLNNFTLKMITDDYCQAWWDLFDAEFPQQVKHSLPQSDYTYTSHTMSITDFDPGSSYKILGYAVNKDLDTIVTDTLTYIHPEIEMDSLIAKGFKYYTVWVEAGSITSTSAKLRTWTTENCDFQIEIGTTKINMIDYPTDTGINASNPGYWQHGRVVEGLLPNTRYYFRITNTNIDGETIKSSIHSFKTLP